jgi:TetR/AcrR family transcriptional regulator, transcriptional repressor of bet genes
VSRTADHDARRRQVAAALVRVIARGGLPGASLSAVAEEAGVSVGLIQRYFATKDELLAFVFAYLVTRTEERVAEVDVAGPRAEVAFRRLAAMLPLDDERFAESSAWVAFLAGTLPAPGAIAPHVVGMRRMHAALTGAGLDRAEAVLLVSTVDGLILDMVTNPEDVAPAVAAECLRRAVERAFR